METMVLDRGSSTFLVNTAHVVRSSADLDMALLDHAEGWDIDQSNPFIQWGAGDFVEGDKANSNKQFWTAGDLELAEYTIKYAPLNMIHKFRTPVGFYAQTRTISLANEEGDNSPKSALDEPSGSMKIQALSGLWSHIFPFEAQQVEAASEEGTLFFSMECRGTHLICAGPFGCGGKFPYAAVEDHCEHLLSRTSIRHIVSPTFRGGAYIVPPVKPGWKNANASVLQDAVMAEAAAFAEQQEAQYKALVAGGTEMTASGWEHLMAMVIQSTRP